MKLTDLLNHMDSPWVLGAVLLPLIYVAIVDWRTRTVPRLVTVALLLCGAVRAIALGNWPGLLALLIASFDLHLNRENGAWDTIAHGLLLFWAVVLAQLRGNPEYAVLAFVTLFTYHFWQLHWLGGGDGMLLVGLLSWQPTLPTLLCLLGGWVLAGAIMAWRQSRSKAMARLLLPAGGPVTEEDLARHGVPTAFGFTLGWAAVLAWNLALVA